MASGRPESVDQHGSPAFTNFRRMTTSPDPIEMQRSSRDPEDLRRRLEAWLGTQLPADAEPTVAELGAAETNGMSSETLLFDAEWTEGGERTTHELVGRMAPHDGDVPVFPSYELDVQFDVIRLVGERTSVPVPPTYWYEGDPSHLGAPLFVMGRVEGIVPPDVMPYTFGDNWLYEASSADQRKLQDATVGAIAGIHSIAGDDPALSALAGPGDGRSPLRRHVDKTRAWYEWTVGDGVRSPLLDRGFEWLDANWPSTEGPPVLSWGDSRIGNVIYRDFEPVAVLDWEMVGVGPRELDLGWLSFAHRVFESIAATFELPGMPHFLRTEDVAETYETVTGETVGPLDWYLAYAGVQWGVVFLRTGQRSAHFGEIVMPDDVDELMHHRFLLAELIG